jgi:hypothetical protein
MQITSEDTCIFMQLHSYHCRLYTLSNSTLTINSNIQKEGKESCLCKTSEGTSYLSEQLYGKKRAVCIYSLQTLTLKFVFSIKPQADHSGHMV